MIEDLADLAVSDALALIYTLVAHAVAWGVLLGLVAIFASVAARGGEK